MDKDTREINERTEKLSQVACLAGIVLGGATGLYFGREAVEFSREITNQHVFEYMITSHPIATQVVTASLGAEICGLTSYLATKVATSIGYGVALVGGLAKDPLLLSRSLRGLRGPRF